MELRLEGCFTTLFKINPCFIWAVTIKQFLTEISIYIEAKTYILPNEMTSFKHQNLTKSNRRLSRMPNVRQGNQVNFWRLASLPAQINLLLVTQDLFSPYFTIKFNGPVKDGIFMSPRVINSHVWLPSCWTPFP